jgi:putative oxidoreductase
MKIATIIVRILLGLLYAFSAVSFFFHLAEMPPLEGNPKIFMDGIIASGYLLHLVKVTELVCGLALIVGLFAPLATVIIFPITLNILFFTICTAHANPGMAIGMLVANLFLAYAYRENYKTLLSMK